MNLKRSIKIYDTAVSVCTLASCALLLLCFIFSFEADKGYFVWGALPVFFCITFGAGMLISFIAAESFKKGEIVKTPIALTEGRTKLALCATVTILLGVLNFLLNGKEHETVLLFVSLATCAIGIYFLLIARSSSFTFSKARLICLFVAILLPLGITLGNNSNYLRSINSVENKLSAIFSISLLLYILYEGKHLYEGAHSRLHFSSMLLTTHCGITLSSAYMLAYLFGAVNEEARFYQMILVLAVSITVKVELDRFVDECDAHTEAEWQELEAAANAEAELEATEDAPTEATDDVAEEYAANKVEDTVIDEPEDDALEETENISEDARDENVTLE